MRYKLLSVEGNKTQNIGDYIQALAALQYYPSLDGFIDREKMNMYDGEFSTVIMNGWFMHNPQNWPPSGKVKPLFVAFHLNNSCKEEMLSDAGVLFFKKHEPIGCRDTFTRDLLLSKGIDAFFSGCLTLTLGDKYRTKEQKRRGVYIVDPIIPNSTDVINIVQDVFSAVIRPRTIYKLAKKLKASNMGIKNILLTSRFYRLYKKYYCEKDLINAEYIQHETAHYLNDFKDETARLNEAERLIKLYANAEYVITSRIHCALPCLGLNTPVYFTYWEKDSFINSCRFGGLKELFNGIKCTRKGLITDFRVTGPLSTYNIIPNKMDWQQLADSLAAICRGFFIN